MLPIEETSATADPVTPPKNIEATTTICARLPGSQPTSTSAMRTRRIATPPRAISVPAKTKKITASSGNVLSEVSMRCTIVALSTPGRSSVATSEAMPTENEIGTPTVISRRKTRPRMTRVTALVHRMADLRLVPPEQRIDDALDGEQQEQGARDRHRDVVPVVRVRNRLHHVGPEILHEHDAVAEHVPLRHRVREGFRARHDGDDSAHELLVLRRDADLGRPAPAVRRQEHRRCAARAARVASRPFGGLAP